jgi:hypothetical protein
MRTPRSTALHATVKTWLALPLLCLGLGIATQAQAQTTVAGSTPGQFAVSPSGAATYSIPIQVPPGVAGMAPKLELVYNSQGGNGMLGMGWSLSGLSAITRCPRNKASDGVMGSVNFDANDRFCMDGQRLILVDATGNAVPNQTGYGAAGTQYRTETESFSKITANGTAGNGPASFTVKTKSGLTMEFGATVDSAIEAIKAPGSIATWPAAAIRVWAQNKVTDVKGNYYTVSYDEDAVNGAYYPSRIDYTGNATSTPALAPMASVRFVPTVVARLDVVPAYQGGAVVKTTKRIGNVHTFNGDSLLKRYDLHYPAQSAATEKSILGAVYECDGSYVCVAPIEFSWSPQGWGWGPPQSQDGLNSVGTAGIWFVDINGDGLADYVTKHKLGPPGMDYNPNLHWNLSTGTGWAAAQAQGGLNGVGSAGISFVDINGDGMADYVTKTDDGAIYWNLSAGDGWGPSQVQGGLNGVGTAGIWFVDINGDGLADYVTKHKLGPPGMDYNPNLHWNLSTGTGWAAAQAQGGLNGVGSAGIWFVDINGDGMADYVTKTDDGTTYWNLSAGDGWGPSQVQGGLHGIGTKGIWFADINGDGLPDYVTKNDDGTIHWNLNQHTPSRLIVIKTGPAQSVSTVLTYSPLTNAAVYTKDSGANKAVYPKQDIQSAMYVVSSVATSNGVGGTNTTNYTYGGLKAEVGRGMLGFRWTKSTEQATGLENYTEYRQDFPYTGIPLMSETRLAGKGNNGVLKRNTNTVECKIPLNGSACAIQTQCHKAGTPEDVQNNNVIKNACIAAANARYFPVVTSATEASWDLNGAVFPVTTTTTSYAADADGRLYGDVGTITVGTNDGAYKQTVNTYYPADTINWVLGRLKSATVTSVKP